MDNYRLAHEPGRFAAPAADWDRHTVNEQPNQQEAYEVMNGVAVRKLKTVYEDESGEEKKIVQYEVSFKVTDRHGDASRVMTLTTNNGMSLKKTMQMVKTMQLACRKFDREQFVYFTNRSYFQLEEVESTMGKNFTLLVHDPRYNEMSALISPTRNPTHAILRPLGDRQSYQLTFNFEKAVQGKEGYNELAKFDTFSQKMKHRLKRFAVGLLGGMASKIGLQTYNHAQEVDRMVNVWETVLKQPDANDTYDRVVEGWEKEGALAGGPIPKYRWNDSTDGTVRGIGTADIPTLQNAYTVSLDRYHAKKKLVKQLEKGMEALKNDYGVSKAKLAEMKQALELARMGMHVAEAQMDAFHSQLLYQHIEANGGGIPNKLGRLESLDGRTTFQIHTQGAAVTLNKLANRLEGIRYRLKHPAAGDPSPAQLRASAKRIITSMRNISRAVAGRRILAERLKYADCPNRAELHAHLDILGTVIERENGALGDPNHAVSMTREGSRDVERVNRFIFENKIHEFVPRSTLFADVGMPNPLTTGVGFEFGPAPRN